MRVKVYFCRGARLELMTNNEFYFSKSDGLVTDFLMIKDG